MKRKRVLHGTTFFLAICVSAFSLCFCFMLMAGEYYSARKKLDTHNRELQGWEACRQTKPAYVKENAEAVNLCLKNLDEAKANFWVKLPKAQLVGLFVLGGIGSATGGYLVTWVVVLFGGLGIYKSIRWLVLLFRRKPIKQMS